MPFPLLDNLNNFTSRIRSGVQGFVQGYRQEYFVADKEFDWDSYIARQSRYYHNRRMLDNTLYSAVNRTALTYKNTEQLYKFIRGLRNPISRLVSAEMDKVFGGFVNFETFEDGAIQIKGADESLLEAIRTIYQWTDISSLKNLLVREGSTSGDVGILVVDDMPREKVYLEVVDPRKAVDIRFDARGNVTEIMLCDSRYDYETKKWYDFGLYISKEWYRTYRDNKPHAYMSNEDGSGVAEWPNPYGWVPFRWVKHVDNGMLFGETSFQNTRTKIDNLNDLMSMLNNNIRRTVETKYAVTGDATIPRDALGNPISISVSTDTRDSSPLLQLKGGDIKPIVFPLNIGETLMAVDSQMKEVEADLPILALQNIRNMGGTMSGVTVENLYSDGLGAVATLQGNYYNALIAVTQMAISIAAFRRYDGFRAYNLNSYDNGTLDFVIRPKSVFQDKVSTEKNIELTMQAVDSNAASLVLPKLGYTQEEIDEVQAQKTAAAAKASRATLKAQADNLRLNAAQKRLQETATTTGAVTVDTVNQEEAIAL